MSPLLDLVIFFDLVFFMMSVIGTTILNMSLMIHLGKYYY